jgi:hypothetical protein
MEIRMGVNTGTTGAGKHCEKELNVLKDRHAVKSRVAAVKLGFTLNTGLGII